MDSEESQKQLLKKMMEESFKQEDLYTAGNYWKFYEKKILDQIKKNKLKNFRSWEGGGGAGNIQSFGGGNERTSRSFLRNFHPFEKKYEFLDNLFIVKKYNSLINKLIPYFSVLKYFTFRSAEARIYHKNLFNSLIFQKFDLIKKIDNELVEISDSEFGLEKDSYTLINNKIYTNNFLNQLLFIHQIKKTQILIQ